MKKKDRVKLIFRSRCKIRWTEKLHEKDWRADGYHWRQDAGAKKVNYNGVTVKKFYFKLRIGEGKDADAFSRDFTKRTYMHPEYPNEELILYDGDASVVNPKYSHGNARPEKIVKPYFRTAPSVIQTAKGD